MDTIAQVIHECETRAAIKQAKQVKPQWYGGQWLKYKYGEAWQIDYITLPQTSQTESYVLTIVEATTEWLETYLMPSATPVTTSWALASESYGYMARSKELSQTMELVSETTSWRPGPKNTVLSGCITSPTMHQPLEKSNGTLDC